MPSGASLDHPDSAAINALARDLARGQSETAGALFAAQGAPAPMVVWHPTLADAPHPLLRSFLRATGMPEGALPVQWLESEGFKALSDWTMIVAPDADGELTYRHYGAGIADAYRIDMTGRRVRDIGGHVSVFFQALYRAAEGRRSPVLSLHEAPRQVFVRSWRRIIQPIEDAGGAPAGFAVVNIPDNDLRAGLEVLPDAVMVVASDGELYYANRAACLLFERLRGARAGETVQAFTGLDLALPESPEGLIRGGRPLVRRDVIAQGAQLLPLRLSIGATFYRDAPIYVVSARPDDA